MISAQQSSIPTPAWADSLVDLVMAHEGISDPPDVTWTHGPLPKTGPRSLRSAGVTCGNAIVIDQGVSERDARHTLLHELAHWATESGHTAAMYAKLYELLWLFGEADDLDYARVREAEYQPGPAQLGWNRFLAKTQSLATRVEDLVERLAVCPIPAAVRILAGAVGVALGVDSLQHIG